MKFLIAASNVNILYYEAEKYSFIHNYDDCVYYFLMSNSSTDLIWKINLDL